MQIPEKLATAVRNTFPGYRAPLEADNLIDDIKYNRENGGSGCLGVATADFDGDGTKDSLLGLTPLQGEAPLAVVGLSRGESWRFYVLGNGAAELRRRLYVEAVPPGRHDRTEALEGSPLDEGEKQSLECPNWGAVIGMTESTGIVFCYTNGEWFHVRVSD